MFVSLVGLAYLFITWLSEAISSELLGEIALMHVESDTWEGLIDNAVFTCVVFSLQTLYHRIIICGMKGACR